MTDMLQKSENVAKNVANKNSQDLTKQWRKRELPARKYYYKDTYNDSICEINDDEEIFFLGWECGYAPDDYNVKDVEIYAPVPTLEELQNMNEAVNECMAANIKLVEQNKQLKELLKECSIANTALVSIMDWLRKSTIPEQRENCAKLFEKTQELQKRLDEVLQ